MPITPFHLWHESENWVSIDIKIPNVTTSSADIITTECYVKVNSTPYFFEADLFGEVDCKMSKASVGVGAVKFFLVKKQQGLWERLSIQGSKDMRLQRRQQSLEAIRQERENLRKEYPAKFSNLGRVAVGDQMRIDENKRKIIENRKEAENLMEQKNIETWKEDLIKPSHSDDKHHFSMPPPLQKNWDTSGTYGASPTSRQPTNRVQSTPQYFVNKNLGTSSTSVVGKSIPKDQGTFKNIQASNTSPQEGCTIGQDSPVFDHDMFPDGDFQSTSSPVTGSGKLSAGNCDGGLRYTGPTLPPPRNCSTVSVTFSPKPDLPKHLPARESRDREIKLKKSAMASGETLDVSERAPLFLQDKGDKFFKAGDYQSAVNAYTDALEKDPSLVTSFANRGACKLHSRDYQGCVQDCTSALCILTKGTPDYAQETILAQTLLVQENGAAQNASIPHGTCNAPSTSCELSSEGSFPNNLATNTVPNMITFPVDSLELLTWLSGQGCCSMRGLTVEGAGVEEWKVGMRWHMLIRRGVARFHTGDLSKAIGDFTLGAKIKPDNDHVKRILKELRMCFEEIDTVTK